MLESVLRDLDSTLRRNRDRLIESLKVAGDPRAVGAIRVALAEAQRDALAAALLLAAGGPSEPDPDPDPSIDGPPLPQDEPGFSIGPDGELSFG